MKKYRKLTISAFVILTVMILCTVILSGAAVQSASADERIIVEQTTAASSQYGIVNVEQGKNNTEYVSFDINSGSYKGITAAFQCSGNFSELLNVNDYTIYLSNGSTMELYAKFCGIVSETEYQQLAKRSEDSWKLSFADAAGDAQIETNSEDARFTVSCRIETKKCSGYGYYYVDRESGMCYQFEIRMPGTVYDEDAIQNALDSILL